MLSLEVRKADFLDRTIAHYCGGGKIRSRFINEDRHYSVSWLIRKYVNHDLKDILNKAKIFFQAPAIKVADIRQGDAFRPGDQATELLSQNVVTFSALCTPSLMSIWVASTAAVVRPIPRC